MRRALCLLLGSLAVQAALPREDLLKEARRVMEAARYCALVSHGQDGRISARTLDPFSPDADFVVWITTNPQSRKVGEIRRDPKVTLYYLDEKTSAYVSLQGRAMLVDAPGAMAEHWKEAWAPFYKDRPRGLALLRFQPERIEVSSPASGIGSDEATWAPQVAELKPGKNRVEKF